MKLNGIQIEEHGSGFAVTLRLHVGREEVDDLTEEGFAGEVLARTAASVRALSSDDYESEYNTGAVIIDPAEEEVEEEEVEEEEVEEEEVEEEEPPKAKRRRRKKGSRETSEEASDEDPTPAPSATGRRRRGSRASAADASSSTDTEDAKTAGRKSRRGKASAPTASPSDITDQDLTKAASDAATVVGTKVVKSAISVFAGNENQNGKKTTVSDIPAAKREKFLAHLMKLVEAEEEE